MDLIFLQRRAAVFIGAAAGLAAPVLPDAAAVSFSREVRPVLSDKCFKCHGFDPEARKADLRLDTKEGEEGAARVLDPQDSELLARVFSDDPDEQMPPPAAKKPLSEAEKETLRAWVEGGSPYQPHWAFQPVVRPEVPEAAGAGWGENVIDRFVVEGLAERGLAPSPEAGRAALLRRVSLDLIGLPPTEDETAAFLGDGRPDAYGRLVDRLLASPQYGERWARRWLDLARYADTNGYEKDRPRSIWPYRDWVIDALNAGMPFDEFTIKQLAGDLLPEATDADRVATGFHRNTMLNEEGGIDPLEFRFYSVVDRVSTTGKTWLGLTVDCAQCHTHKYDPVSHTEYFRLMAYLNNADEPEMKVWTDELRAAHEAAEREAQAMEAALAEQWPVGTTEWTPAVPESVVSENGATVERAGDGGSVVSVSGESPERDTTTVDLTAEGGSPVTHLRIEALADGQDGPGRTPHGNFVLSEVRAWWAPGDGDRGMEAVEFSGATADFAQDRFPATHAVDGDVATGWAVDGEGKRHEDRSLTLTFSEPVDPPAGTRLRVELVQGFGGGHTLRRFRVVLGRQAEDPGREPAEAAEEAFGRWVAERAPGAVEWEVLQPAAATSGVPMLEVLDDGSVLASGDQTKSDTYAVRYRAPLEGVTAVRLEALPHESLPAGGPGRTFYEGRAGDFFLSEIDIVAGGEDVPIAAAKEDFGKLAIGSGDSSAALAFDGNEQTGWSTSGREGEPHAAVFRLAEPLDAPGGIDLRLLFERHYSAGLGRFRLSVARAPLGWDDPVLPAAVEATLTKPRAAWSAAEAGAARAFFFSRAPELEAARGRVQAVRERAPGVPTTLVMSERPDANPRPTHRHHRGEWLNKEERVGPGLPAVFDGLGGEAPTDRLGFARWLVGGENPLTARVVANRAWQAFFGRGIVETVQDFGFQGSPPSHPALLDWLASELMDSGWDMKALHRTIVTSATYRQDSRISADLLERDPENILLARGPRVRLDAELIRDSALLVSGLLTPTLGGPSVFPPQPASVTTEGAYGQLAWDAAEGPDRWRRSLYTYAKRTAPFAMYTTFDAPTGEACVARREVSNSPLQALTLLNDTVFMECAQELGRLAAAWEGDDHAKAVRLFRRCLTRTPDAEEARLLAAFVGSQRDRFLAGDLDPAELAGPGEGSVAERAVWTAAARAILNLDEMIVKG